MTVSVCEFFVDVVDVAGPLVVVQIQKPVRAGLATRRHLHKPIHEILLVAPAGLKLRIKGLGFRIQG